MNSSRIRTVTARMLHWASAVVLIAFAAYMARTLWAMYTRDAPDGYLLVALTFVALGLTIEMIANRIDPYEGEDPLPPVLRPRLLAYLNVACIVGGVGTVVTCVVALVRDDSVGYTLVAVGAVCSLAQNITTGILRDMLTVKPEELAA